MNNTLKKIRILGSGFTKSEYDLYNFDSLNHPDEAMQYLSNQLNHDFFQPVLNSGTQIHILEDKWVMQQYLTSMNLPVPKTYGLLHPQFGISSSGKPFQQPNHLASIIEPDLPTTLFIKPRGGRQGRNIFKADVRRSTPDKIVITSNGHEQDLDHFFDSLPHDAFDDYGGGYHGWLVQAYIQQHDFLNTLNPYTVNTVRVLTFIDSNNNIQVQHAILRLGRRGGTADNWTSGGLAVAIDTGSGRLGYGLLKPPYNHERLLTHPDTNIRFEGEILPEWPSIVEVCLQAASQFSGIRTIGWDIALSPSGPVIIEGNSNWGVPSIQMHTHGYLTTSVRQELLNFGLYLPERARSLPAALLYLLFNQWQRSRGPRIINKIKSSLSSLIRYIGPKSSRPRILR